MKNLALISTTIALCGITTLCWSLPQDIEGRCFAIVIAGIVTIVQICMTWDAHMKGKL